MSQSLNRPDESIMGATFSPAPAPPHEAIASKVTGVSESNPRTGAKKRGRSVVTRTLTLAPSKGAPTPRAAETASGMISFVGLQNPGVEAWLADPKLLDADKDAEYAEIIEIGGPAEMP